MKVLKTKKKKRDFSKGEHLGIELDMPVYHARRDLTQKDLSDFVDAYVDLVEKFGWWTGGGGKLIDMNK